MQESSIDVEQVKTPEPTVYWLPELNLTFDDQEILTGGRWLSSRHISAVYTLLKKQYPQQSGLQDTLQLSNNYRWASNSKNFVQIIHIFQNHWVCVSNVLTPKGVVEVYDSLAPICNNTLTGQIAAIMQCSSQEFTVRWVNVQLQSGEMTVLYCSGICRGPVCWSGSSCTELQSVTNETSFEALLRAWCCYKVS